MSGSELGTCSKKLKTRQAGFLHRSGWGENGGLLLEKK
jgi:hypothetical protein